MDRLVLEFVGELDAEQCAQFADGLSGASEVEEVAVDISKLTYLDSTFLSALVKLRRIRIDGGHTHTIRVFGAGRMARRIFELTRLDRVFTLASPGERPNGSCRCVMIFGRVRLAVSHAEPVEALLSPL